MLLKEHLRIGVHNSIIIISNIIYNYLYITGAGGLAGMAPFILILNSIISFVVSFINLTQKYTVQTSQKYIDFHFSFLFLTLIIYFCTTKSF
jgi:hypothetical protein